MKIRFPYVVDKVLDKDQDIFWLCLENSSFGKPNVPPEKQESHFFYLDEKTANEQIEEMNKLFEGRLTHCLRKEKVKAGFKYSEILYGMEDGTYTANCGNYWRYSRHDYAIDDAENSLISCYFRNHYHLADKLKDNDWMKPFEIDIEDGDSK